jgi:MFS family permease
MLTQANSEGSAAFTMRETVQLALLIAIQVIIASDLSLASLAVPSIASSFHVSALSAQWAISGMMLGFAGFLLVGGRLSDIYGQRFCLCAGLALYCAGALGSGVAGSMPVLIASRVLQGLGAAILYPAALSLIFLIFAEGPRRFRALSLSSAIQCMATSLSAIAAGWLFSRMGWRGAFLMAAPLGVLTLGLTPFSFPKRPGSKAEGGVDFLGAGLATLSSALLVWTIPGLVTEHASATMLVCCAAGVAGAGAFVLLQRRLKAPLIPRDVVQSKNFALGVILVSMIATAVGGLLSIGLMSMQRGLHLSPLQAGLGILPYGSASLAVSLIAPRFAPLIFGKPALSLALALSSLAACYLLVALAPADPTSFLCLMTALSLAPIAGIVAFNLAMSETLRFVRAERQGVASGLVYAALQLVLAIGLALMVAVAHANSQQSATASLAAFAPSFWIGAVLSMLGVGLSLFIARTWVASAAISGAPAE